MAGHDVFGSARTFGRDVHDPRFGIRDRRPVDVARAGGTADARAQSRRMAYLDRRIEERANLVALDALERLLPELGCEVDEEVLGELLYLERCGFGGERLRR